MANQQPNHRLNLEENSRYRIAWEMALHISKTKAEAEAVKDREYFLRLARQCYNSIDNYHSIEEVVTGKKANQSMGIRF